MSDYLPTPAGDHGATTPIESQGRYAVATFELFQASTDALDDLAGDWPESAPKPVVLVGGEDGPNRHPDLTASSGWLLDLL